jgi:hypothetical protein
VSTQQPSPELLFCALAARVAPASADHTQTRSRWLAAGVGAGIALVASHVTELTSYLDLWWLRTSVVVAVLSLAAGVIQEFVSMTIPPAIATDPATASAIAAVGMDNLTPYIDKTVPFYMRRGWRRANSGGRFHPEFLGGLLLRKHHRLREIFFFQMLLATAAVAALGCALVLN